MHVELAPRKMPTAGPQSASVRMRQKGAPSRTQHAPQGVGVQGMPTPAKLSPPLVQALPSLIVHTPAGSQHAPVHETPAQDVPVP